MFHCSVNRDNYERVADGLIRGGCLLPDHAWAPYEEPGSHGSSRGCSNIFAIFDTRNQQPSGGPFRITSTGGGPLTIWAELPPSLQGQGAGWVRIANRTARSVTLSLSRRQPLGAAAGPEHRTPVWRGSLAPRATSTLSLGGAGLGDYHYCILEIADFHPQEGEGEEEGIDRMQFALW